MPPPPLTSPAAVPRLGATVVASDTVEFAIWAPGAASIEVCVGGAASSLRVDGCGFWRGEAAATAGDRYLFRLDGRHEFPDPCSRAQPDGVRGPSEIVGRRQHAAAGIALGLDELVVYELHVGTFTREGTLGAAAAQLEELASLGVTAVELMPVATFPGTRGWGYDGLYTWAPHQAYGGPRALAEFVDRAHEYGLGVILDVVYNHVGPGNEALTAFGPYFTDRWGPTAWGDALDYRNIGVREWAIQNAEMWVSEYGVDGLRLDAVGAVADDSGEHVCAELARRVKARRRQTLVISERGAPDFTPLEKWHHDAVWVDSLHHELHVALTGERDEYYARHDGSMSAIARELLRPERRQVVVAAQNHDQIGNRATGDRLTPARLRVAESVVVFSESIPLLFQGEEYAEPHPFQYFTDHIDPEIAEATRLGRMREFPDTIGTHERVPDPQAPETFEVSKLDRAGGNPAHREALRRLLRLRRALPQDLRVEADDERRTLRLYRGDALLHVDFNALSVELSAP